MVDYSEMSEDEWNQLPSGKEKQPDQWEPLLADLSRGKIVSLPYADPKDRRAKRMTIARRAYGCGFKTEARYTESHMALRRSETTSPAPQEKPRQGRRKDAAAE